MIGYMKGLILYFASCDGCVSRVPVFRALMHSNSIIKVKCMSSEMVLFPGTVTNAMSTWVLRR